MRIVYAAYNNTPEDTNPDVCSVVRGGEVTGRDARECRTGKGSIPGADAGDGAERNGNETGRCGSGTGRSGMGPGEAGMEQRDVGWIKK